MSKEGLTIETGPKYVWCWTDKIEETVRLIGKEPVKIETPCEFGLEWTKLYFEEELNEKTK